jgi:surface protein
MEQASFGGDDQLATKAQLNKPYGVFVDSNEDVFVADKVNKKIRKIGGLTQAQYVNILTQWKSEQYSTDENYGRIEYWNTKDVTDMKQSFNGVADFKEDISKWDTSKVKDMSEMFKDATLFNEDISGWKTNNVTTMAQMFYNASSFNQDITNWNISNIDEFDPVFGLCLKYFREQH